MRPVGDGAGLVEHDRVDAPGRLEDLRALDEQPELRAAPGADQERGRRRQAQRARAGDDQHGDGRGEGERRALARRRARSRASRRRARARPARRRRRRGRRAAARGALPDCASVTSRAICASAVSAPTRVARTTSRPPALTVAPATSSPGRPRPAPTRRSAATASTAEAPSSTTPSVATFSPGRTTKRSPTRSCSTGTRRSVPSASSTATSLAPELEQRLQRRAGAALGPRLEVAAGEDERRHDGGDLEVDVSAPAPRRGRARTPSACRSRRRRRGTARTRPDHAASVPMLISVSIVAAPWREVRPRRPVERPAAPQHDRRGERERQPLPAVELQRAGSSRAAATGSGGRAATISRRRSRGASASSLGVGPASRAGSARR